MRNLHFSPVFILLLICNVLQGHTRIEDPDTLLSKKDAGDSLFSVTFRSLPDFARYEKRYKILSNVNNDYRPININHTLQNFIRDENYNDSSLLTGYMLSKERRTDGKVSYSDLAPYNTISDRELIYGVWRNQITGSSTEGDIKKSVTEGTNTLISLGYSDFGNDFLPFVTELLEEHHLYNYDGDRTLASGNASKGIITSVEILNSIGMQDPRIKAGVCRDVHETGRELLKTMSEVYYGHFYPGRKIDFDDYLFLQSWVTNKSQHVTLSLIDPFDNSNVYELDWGRVLEKSNNGGYNNGRMYGNTYRIWKYDRNKQRSVPIDFRRSQFGKILDEDILTNEEYQQFNGIKDEEFYSNIRYLKKLEKGGNLNFSTGIYHPYQKYFLSSYFKSVPQKKLFSFLNYSGKFAFQAAIHEDTRKKQLLYPEAAWHSAVSLAGVPRYISKFTTPQAKLGKNITVDAFFNQQFDAFMILNSFTITDSVKNEISHSGDANLSLSNGFNLYYTSGRRNFNQSFTFLGRSCLLAKDIRLMSPNPAVLIPNITIITPAVDIISNTLIRLSHNKKMAVNGILEFTNMKAVLFSGSVSAHFDISETKSLTVSAGMNDQIKGIRYFWYPVARKRLDLKFDFFSNSLDLSLQRIPWDHVSFNVGYRRYL